MIVSRDIGKFTQELECISEGYGILNCTGIKLPSWLVKIKDDLSCVIHGGIIMLF